ncbi:MAG: hypothetical protein Q8Q37_02510 [bacterium]|nr:hypothetical protein [bacterium]
MTEKLPPESSKEKQLTDFRNEIKLFKENETSTAHLADESFDVMKLTVEDMNLWRKVNDSATTLADLIPVIDDHEANMKSLLSKIDQGDITGDELDAIEERLSEEDRNILKRFRDGDIPEGQMGRYRDKLKEIMLPKTRTDFLALIRNIAMRKAYKEYKNTRPKQQS